MCVFSWTVSFLKWIHYVCGQFIVMRSVTKHVRAYKKGGRDPQGRPLDFLLVTQWNLLHWCTHLFLAHMQMTCVFVGNEASPCPRATSVHIDQSTMERNCCLTIWRITVIIAKQIENWKQHHLKYMTNLQCYNNDVFVWDCSCNTTRIKSYVLISK